MAKSDARFGYRADLNRETHVLSAPFGFTTAPGMLNPIFHDFASPGDTYYIDHKLDFLRTAPLAAPAMVDVLVHYESFFVPMQMLYSPFEDSFFSMKTVQSNMFDMNQYNLNDNLPLYNFSYECGYILSQLNHSVSHSEAFRLCDLFGLNADNLAKDNGVSRFEYKPSFFPYQILAYHAIFNYFYRLDDKTEFNRDFNFDNQYNQSTPSQDRLLFLHQRPWDFDYFTSIYRSPIVSDASMQKVMHSAAYTDLNMQPVGTLDNGVGYNTSGNSNQLAFTSKVKDSYDKFDQLARVSTATIRQMFANEKLAMITGRARKTYDSQVLSHFGVNVPHDPKHDIALIGHDTYPLRIGEVTSLASTETTPLGELAGKGWSQGSSHKPHKFTAPCHGVVMTIFSVEPKKRYYGGFQRYNSLTSIYDLPIPEFDRLGNVPMFRYEIGEHASSGMSDVDTIGWKERYYQWKRRPARVTLAFQHGLRNQGINNYETYMISTPPFGVISNSKSARPDIESRFYIDRGSLDGIMLTPFVDEWQTGDGFNDTENWNQSPWLAYARDPFIVNSDLRVKKVSWMSKDGEPVYNF